MHAARFAYLPALALVLLAVGVSACGVKGELERPAAPATATSAPETSSVRPDTPAPGPSTSAVFTERSRVISDPPEVLPTMPPKEWSKNRGQQEARQKSSIAPSSRPPDPDPGKRFFLDWLL